MTDPEQGARSKWHEEMVHGALSSSGEAWRAWGKAIYGRGMSRSAFIAATDQDALQALAILEHLEATAARVEALKQALRRIEEDPYDGRFVAAQVRAALNQGTTEEGKDG